MAHILEDNSVQSDPSNNANGNVRELIEEAANDSTGDQVGNFFTQLDQQVTGRNQNSANVQTTQDIGPEHYENADNDSDDAIDYKKRYGDSTREARELKSQLKEYEQYLPLIDAMKTDEGFANMVKNYSQGNTEPGYNDILNELGLGEDFEFDAEEAVSDEKSASGKVLRSLIDVVASQRASQAENTVLKTVKDYLDVERFKRDNNLNDEQFNEIANFAENLKLDWETIYNLMKVQKGEQPKQTKQKQSQPDARESMRQRRVASNIPNSLSGSGNSSNTQDPNEKVFNAILGINKSRDFSKIFESAK